jgi:hypothetical protein
MIPPSEEHLEDAAALVSSRYKTLSEQEPLLPHRYQEVSNLLPFLRNIHQATGPGVAAFLRGRLVGFMKAWQRYCHGAPCPCNRLGPQYRL